MKLSPEQYWLEALRKNADSIEVLNDIGFSEAEDFKDLDQGDFRRLAATMKKLPAKRFLRTFGISSLSQSHQGARTPHLPHENCNYQ